MANGKVFVPTINSLVVYGLLNEKIIPGGSGRNSMAAQLYGIRLTRHFISVVLSHPGNFEVTLSDIRGRIVAGLQGSGSGGERLRFAACRSL